MQSRVCETHTSMYILYRDICKRLLRGREILAMLPIIANQDLHRIWPVSARLESTQSHILGHDGLLYRYVLYTLYCILSHRGINTWKVRGEVVVGVGRQGLEWLNKDG